MTLEEINNLLDAATAALPPAAQRHTAKLEESFGCERTMSRAEEERQRRNIGLEHPLKRFPALAEFLRSPEAQVSPDASGITIETWTHWLLDAHLICREPYTATKWAPHKYVLQRAAESSRIAETIVFRGEAWAAAEIPRRFPIGGTFRVPRLTSTSPSQAFGRFYAASKTHDCCVWDGEIQEPVVLAFHDPCGITGIHVPDLCAAAFPEVVIPKGAVYSVTSVDRDEAYVQIALTA